jgi:iron complex outermembrane recepter protein
VSTSNRVPSPQMWRPIATSGGGTGGFAGVDSVPIYDPARNQSYRTNENAVLNPSLRPEAALTQTAGVMFERGKIHRVRVALDFVDTNKVNELTSLDPKTVVALESYWPERVVRAPLAPGDLHKAGYVTSVTTSTINMAARHSQNWNTSIDYSWTECAGGTLELYGRLLAFTRYNRRLLPGSPTVDELGAPDDSGSPLLKYRSNFGGAWSNRAFGAGIDGHYFHSRVLPLYEQGAQGHDRIRPFWQFDAFVQHDLAAWLPWKSSRYGLRVQARVNNVLGAPFPKYVNDNIGADVQPYGDWRGRVYSLSLTASF